MVAVRQGAFRSYGSAPAPSLPSWIPTAGNIVDISTSKMSAAGATSSNFAYSGNILAEDVGNYGAIIHTGGGHGDSRDNALYQYDLEAGTPSKISTAYSSFFVNGSGYVADSTNGEHFTDSGFVNTDQSQPGAFHAYATCVYLPPGYGGAGAQGAYLSTVRSALADTGSNNGLRSHIYDFASPGWARFSSNTVTSFGQNYGPACLFKSRDAVFKVNTDIRGGVAKLDLSTGSWSNQATTGDLLGDRPSSLFAWEAEDLLVFCRPYTGYGSPTNSYNFKVIDCSTWIAYTPGTTGTAPSGLGSGVWVESLEKFYYHDKGSSDVYTLTPSASPTVDPWTWTHETLTGTVANNATTTPEKRLHFSDALGCFVEMDFHNSNVQAFKLAGM
jgi:hypothetical protein